MKTEKDLLKELFHEIQPENTSAGFMEKLMVRVEKEAIKQQRKKQIYNYLSVAAGVTGMIGIPALVLFYFQVDISGIFRGVHIESSYIWYALIILFLLMGDSWLRGRARS